MKKRNKFSIVLCTVMASLVMGSAITSTFAYWDKEKGELNIPTTEFNSTSDEFTYFACVPSISSTFGYDYYDLSQIPEDLVDNVEGLAVVRFEAITKTCFIPPYPEVVIKGKQYNFNGKQELPVIHIVNSLSYGDTVINNGFDHLESLIIPETITYMEHGSLNSSTGLTEVAVLGDETSGTFYYSSDEANLTKNDVNIRYEHENRDKNSENAFSITAPTKAIYQFEQERFHYDYRNNIYSTFIIPGENRTSVNIDTPNASPVPYNVNLTENVKYKLLFDGTALTANEYTYKLDIDMSDEQNELIPLVLNTEVDYEEYILDPSSYPFSVINIPNNPLIGVIEYVNGVANSKSVFNLQHLNASYSRDNTNYEIKFSPSNVYESKHYYEDSNGENVSITTQTQISVEKAYFLNNVSQSDKIFNDRFLRTIAVSKTDDMLGLFVKTNNGITDPNTGSQYIKMNFEDGYYSYSFTGTNQELPTSYTFFNGKYSVVSYPSYISSYTNETDLKESLNYSEDSYVFYYDLSKAGLSGEDRIIGNNTYPEYEWYAIYWDENDVQGNVRLSYMENSDIIKVIIPKTAVKFKFARVDYGVNIDDALANYWAGVERQSQDDILIDFLLRYNQNYITHKECVEDKVTHEYYYVDVNTGLRRLYFDNSLMSSDIHNDDIVVDNGETSPDYRWYLVYWIKENNEDKRYETHISYCVANSTSGEYKLALDIPLSAYKFKLVRIPYDTEISSALTGQWEAVVNQNENDIYLDTIGSYNTIEFTKFYENNSGTFNYTYSTEDILQAYKPLNQAYVTLNDYGQLGNEVYMTIDQNLNYKEGTTVGDTYKYEFYKKESNSTIVQRVSFTEGTLLTANILNPVTGVYNEIDFTELNFTDGYEDYFEIENGSIRIKEDVVGRFYIKMDYNSSTGAISKASIHIEVEVDESISGIIRNVVLDSGAQLDIEEANIEITNQEVSGTYSILSIENSILLGRNHSNKEYEEYYIVNEEGLSGNYVVSKYSTNETKFGYSYPNLYYGTYSESIDNPLGYLVATSEDKMIKFTADSKKIDMTILHLVDQAGNVINSLTYSSNLSSYYGRSEYVVNVPQIYGEEYSINNGEVQIKTDVPNLASVNLSKLFSDYYINNRVDTYGFTKDDASGEYYSYSRMYVGEDETITIYNKNGTKLTLNNNVESLKLDYSIIDGYYYSGLEITNNVVSLPSVGYYDLKIYTINGHSYLGYKYLGEELVDDTSSYYLLINGQTYKMNQGSNKNILYLDVYFDTSVTASVINNNEIVIVDSIALSSGLTRVYVSLASNASWANAYKTVQYEYLSYIFSPGDKSLEPITSNVYMTNIIGLPDNLQVSSEVYYQVTSTGGVNDILTQVDENKWANYIVINTIDDVITVDSKTKTIPYTGTYYIEYDGTKVSITKVEEEKVLNLILNEEVIDELIVRDTSLANEKYLEYTLDEYVLFENEIDLATTPIYIKDNTGYVVSVIEEITLVENGDSTTSTTISPGVYQLNYSVDSSRRDQSLTSSENHGNSNYHVFTYIKLVSKPNSLGQVNFYIPDPLNPGQYNVTQQKINTTDGTILKTFSELDGIVPDNHIFIGWGATSNSRAIVYYDGEKVTQSAASLYPIFISVREQFTSQSHEVIYISDTSFDSTSSIVFTLTNLEGYTISGVYSSVLTDLEIYKPYYNVSNNIITIDPTIFELIGYAEGGQTFVITFTNDFSLEVKLEYPNFENTLTNQN